MQIEIGLQLLQRVLVQKMEWTSYKKSSGETF